MTLPSSATSLEKPEIDPVSPTSASAQSPAPLSAADQAILDAKHEPEGPSRYLPPLTLAQKLRSNLIQVPPFALVTSSFACASLLFSLFDKGGRIQHATAQVWARLMVRIAGSSVAVTGGEVLRLHPVAVYACNHLSYMDTPVIFAALPFQFRILARHDLWKIPFIGWYLKRSGQIPVNADNPRASISSLMGGVRALQSGMPLVVFPEGGRSVDGELQAFMSGPAFMAIRAQVPLVPMALVGTHELFPMHTYYFRPRPVQFLVGEPISTAGLTTRDANALTARLHAEVEKLYYSRWEGKQPAEQVVYR